VTSTAAPASRQSFASLKPVAPQPWMPMVRPEKSAEPPAATSPARIALNTPSEVHGEGSPPVDTFSPPMMWRVSIAIQSQNCGLTPTSSAAMYLPLKFSTKRPIARPSASVGCCPGRSSRMTLLPPPMGRSAAAAL
jgi:hypothetical protein